jgi:outer membrane beta-barrel protein
MKRLMTFAFAAAGLLASTPAAAQDTLDLGTLKNEEITVVQKLLYPKAGRTELHFMLGANGMAFEPWMVAPKIEVGFGQHMSENLGWQLAVGAGYGIGTAAYREVSGVAYGIAPEAYRYLGEVTAGVTWSPVYGKMNWQGQRILHNDVYVPIVAGLTVEQLAWGEKHLSFGPTVGVGVGMRIFQGDNNVIRLELRDDVVLQNRKQSGTMRIKQNVGLHVGFSRLGEKK